MRAVPYFLQDFTDRHEGRHRNVPRESDRSLEGAD